MNSRLHEQHTSRTRCFADPCFANTMLCGPVLCEHHVDNYVEDVRITGESHGEKCSQIRGTHRHQPCANSAHTPAVRKNSAADLRRHGFSPVSTTPITMTDLSISKTKPEEGPVRSPGIPTRYPDPGYRPGIKSGTVRRARSVAIPRDRQLDT